MKKYFLLAICVMLTKVVFGQENKAVTEQLKTRFKYVSFDNGYYRVQPDFSNNNSNQGLFDSQGKQIIPCAYDHIYVSKETEDTGLFEVKQKEKYGLWSISKGKQIIPCAYDHIYVSNDTKETGLIKVGQNEKYGLWSISKGKQVVPCAYDHIYVSNDAKETGLIEVGQKERKGIWSVEMCKEIVPCRYESIITHNYKDNGCIDVELNGRYGLWDKTGKELVPCEYDGMLISYHYNKDTKLIEVEKKDKKGLYRAGVREIIPCMFDFIFEDGEYAAVEKGDKYGMYSLKDCKEIIKCEYNYLACPKEDLIVFQKEENGKYGYMDIKQKVIISPEYDSATSFEDAVAQVTKNGVTSVIKHPLRGTSLNVASGIEVWVDNGIPQTAIKNEEGFAFIIANENYIHLTGADYSHNDGKVFAEYCKKTLGFPENNIRYYEDATYGNIANALKQLKDIADIYDGDAKVILYFSGLGATDEETHERYILPSDASIAALNTTSYGLSALMKTLNELKTKYTLLVIDAPFNGNDKNGKSLATGRGVTISNKEVQPHDNVVGLLGSDNENNYSSKQLQHGILTYSLLEKIKSTKGECTLKELLDNSCQQVKKESLKQFNNVQTPKQIISEKLMKLLTTLKL